MPKMEYMLIECWEVANQEATCDFIELVNTALSEGWQLQGGASVAFSPETEDADEATLYCQGHGERDQITCAQLWPRLLPRRFAFSLALRLSLCRECARSRCSDSKLGRRNRARDTPNVHVHDLPEAIPKANLKTYRLALPNHRTCESLKLCPQQGRHWQNHNSL